MCDYYEITQLPINHLAFASLYYPQKRVMEMRVKDLERTKVYLQHWAATSISAVKKLNEVNPAFSYMLNLAIKMTKDNP